MMNGYSGKELIAFLDYMLDKGLGKPETIKSRRISCGRVFDTIGEQDLQDLREVDVDHIMVRFQNLEGPKFSPGSLNSYKSRVRSSISDFLRFREGPTAFKAVGQRKSRTPSAQTSNVQSSLSVHAEPERQTSAKPVNLASYGLEFPISIRADCIVRLAGLPFDLTKSEAQRIANVVLAMAVISE